MIFLVLLFIYACGIGTGFVVLAVVAIRVHGEKIAEVERRERVAEEALDNAIATEGRAAALFDSVESNLAEYRELQAGQLIRQVSQELQ